MRIFRIPPCEFPGKRLYRPKGYDFFDGKVSAGWSAQIPNNIHRKENNDMETPPHDPYDPKAEYRTLRYIVNCHMRHFRPILVLYSQQRHKQSFGPFRGDAILLSIITCGIYSLFWMYNMGTRIDEVKMRRGMPCGNTGTLYLILALVGFGLVSEILLQGELNKLAE